MTGAEFAESLAGLYVADTPRVREIVAQRFEQATCNECDGRGWVLDAPANVLDGHPYEEPCPKCSKPAAAPAPEGLIDHRLSAKTLDRWATMIDGEEPNPSGNAIRVAAGLRNAAKRLRATSHELSGPAGGASGEAGACERDAVTPQSTDTLSSAAPAPEGPESPVLAFQAWAERRTRERGPMTQAEYYLAQEAFFAAHPGQGPRSSTMAAAPAPEGRYERFRLEDAWHRGRSSHTVLPPSKATGPLIQQQCRADVDLIEETARLTAPTLPTDATLRALAEETARRVYDMAVYFSCYDDPAAAAVIRAALQRVRGMGR